MPFSSLRFIPLLFVFALAACDSSDINTFDIDRYTGDAYEGTLSMETIFPTADTVSVEHNASLVVTDLGSGQARLVFEVDAPDAEPLVLEGSYSDSGAVLTFGEDEPTAEFRINPAGTISGGGEIEFFGSVLEVDASGSATGSLINFILDIEVLDGDEDAPPGTTVSAHLNLSR